MNYRSALDIILQEFYKICEIPHPSHHEEQIGAYLFQWAKDHGLAVTKDRLGDIIIEKPAAPGCEASPRVILQAHMEEHPTVTVRYFLPDGKKAGGAYQVVTGHLRRVNIHRGIEYARKA